MNKRKNNVKPTKLQKKTLEILKENPDMPLSKAMISAGYAEKSAVNPKQNFVESRGLTVALEEWRETLRGRGITEEKLAEKQAEWLDAKKVVSARITGKDADSRTDDFIEVPDYQIQIKAGEMIREDFGIKGRGGDTLVQVNFNQVTDEQREKYGL